MSVIYHHNLQVFSGKNPKNNRFKINHLVRDYKATAMETWSEGQRPLVAGFTEVRHGINAVNKLPLLSKFLMGGQETKVQTISCGRTALDPKPEFVGIAVPRRYNVEYGRVLFDSFSRGIRVFNDRAPGPNGDFDAWRKSLPSNCKADWRGFVYVVLSKGYSQERITCAFVHNRYGKRESASKSRMGDTDARNIRSLVRGSVPEVIKLLYKETGASRVIIGGDFNLPGAPLKGARLYQKGPTTKGNNTYDYWYTNSDLKAAKASVYPFPFRWRPNSSDHAIVRLRFD